MRPNIVRGHGGVCLVLTLTETEIETGSGGLSQTIPIIFYINKIKWGKCELFTSDEDPTNDFLINAVRLKLLSMRHRKMSYDSALVSHHSFQSFR